ncbi:hypothetical protein E5161_15145 [Cohnella pontilimi]|uniref:YugN-like family protein n=1 Tax=Cohnella pontilimi TaxID=2564100 RepID=A0A4U0F8Z7_9BACL|nr:YugN family protein [Cohnella pontilimi]TJY41040.1 hypothetical protein E5161_15145 [Cohnella pontilimi]
MYPISSSLTSQEQEFDKVRSAIASLGFTLSGNWDYDSGSFDSALDEAQKVWLRLPFDVTTGHVDSEADETDAKIRFGRPFVLKHVYNEGLDREAQPRTFGAMLDQFTDPVNADADIEPEWIDKAKQRLHEIEQIYPK